MHTEMSQNTNETSCIGVEEFHTLPALSIYNFIYGPKIQFHLQNSLG
jgi:hypothetical protein